jgi:pilus assembly protein CpaB
MRIVILILASLTVAGGTGYYVLQSMQPPPAAATAEVPAPRTTDVFVPAAELAAGTILSRDRLGRMALAPAAVTDEMFVADDAGADALEGSVARQVLPKGVPITKTAIVQPGERGFLAAVLQKGERAISIPVGEVTGVSGLILPGDRVDIILTYSVDGGTIDAERDIRASETVMTNLRVLALDQRLSQKRVAPDGSPITDAPPIARTATLAVTPQEAEMITLATTLGDLSLVLNSVHDGGDPELAAVAEAEVAPGMTRILERLAASGPEATRPLVPRAMTLDSDVTSLLLKRAPDDAPETEPLAERIQRVQIVRGVASGAVTLSGQTLAGTPEAEPLADPAATPGAD